MVIVSDDLNHTKHSVYVFMQRILTHLKASYPGIETIDIFSDGPTSQFKQRFLFSNLHGWEMEHDLKIRWNFFATSYGKGVVDGIGGTLKRAVWRHVKAERAHVTNPSQYADLGKQLCPNICIEFVSKEDIAQYTSFLDEKWENIKAVPGTHQVHCVRADGSDFVKVSDTTDSTECRRCQIRICTDPNEDKGGERTASNAIDVAVGQWVVVAYDGEQYPGKVTDLSDIEGVEVSVLHRSGSCWKWPYPKDMIYYHKTDTVRHISPPIAAGHRGQFIFSDVQ